MIEQNYRPVSRFAVAERQGPQIENGVRYRDKIRRMLNRCGAH
jgi:hypothetical protein